MAVEVLERGRGGFPDSPSLSSFAFCRTLIDRSSIIKLITLNNYEKKYVVLCSIYLILFESA